MFTFDEKKHAYTLDGKRMYGVTNILNVISKNALIQWAANEAVRYIREHKINEDENILTVAQTTLEEAKIAHRNKKEKAGEKGKETHQLIEQWVTDQIKGTITDIDYLPIQKFINWAVRSNIKFIETEKQLYDSDLFVAGTADLIFEKEGQVYIGDIKTYSKLWDRVPMLQCAGYGLMYEKMYKKKVGGYCVLLMTKEGNFEEQWSYDVKGDTEGFLAAYKLFKILENW